MVHAVSNMAKRNESCFTSVNIVFNITAGKFLSFKNSVVQVQDTLKDYTVAQRAYPTPEEFGV